MRDRIRTLAGLSLAAVLLAGCGLITQAAIPVGGAALERPLQWLENPRPGRCAGDLVRRPEGTWWRCGQLESTPEELAEAAGGGP